MGILSKIFGRERESNISRPVEDDDKTTDNFLRSLRRQRRVQLEQVEKESLKKEIMEHERGMTRRNIYGFTDHENDNFQIKKEIIKRKALKTKKEFMLEQSNIFKNNNKKQKKMFFR